MRQGVRQICQTNVWSIASLGHAREYPAAATVNNKAIFAGDAKPFTLPVFLHPSLVVFRWCGRSGCPKRCRHLRRHNQHRASTCLSTSQHLSVCLSVLSLSVVLNGVYSERGALL